MTTKPEVLQNIEKIIIENNISESEISKIFERNNPKLIKQKHLISKLLMYVGGLVLFLGIVFYVQMNWQIFNSFNRIIITLGLGFATYIAAVILEKKNESEILTQVLHLISIGLLPTGFYVSMHEIGLLNSYSVICSTIIFTILSLHFFLANLYKPKALYQFFLIASLNYLCLTLFALVQQYSYLDFQYFKINEIITITLGISNLLVGFHYRNNTVRLISRVYNFIGSILVLTGFFNLLIKVVESIDVFSPFAFASIILEITYLFVLAASLWLSIIFNRKSILIPTIGFFITYLIRISDIYFSNVLGWPLSLILIGLILISGGFAYTKAKDKIALED